MSYYNPHRNVNFMSRIEESIQQQNNLYIFFLQFYVWRKQEQTIDDRKCFLFISVLIIIKLQCSEYTLLTKPLQHQINAFWNGNTTPLLYLVNSPELCYAARNKKREKDFYHFLLYKKNLFNSGKSRKFSAPFLLNKSIDEVESTAQIHIPPRLSR